MAECACCGEELDQSGECPNDCTESDFYGVAEGALWDEEDVRRESVRRGRCLECGATITEGDTRCPEGCLDD